MEPRNLLGVAEAEALTGVSRWTWRRWAYDGRISSVKLGNRLLIPADEIERLVAAGARTLGSEKSRAAARAMLLARVEQPREKLRLVVSGLSWKPIPGKVGAWELGPLDLEKSTCSRTLSQDGTLWEVVWLYGSTAGLTDEELDKWIGSFSYCLSKSSGV